MTVTSACPECGTELAAGVRFCPECGARRPDEAPSSEVRKLVTVLFADVTGSTALGEQLDPEALRALMTRYFVVMRGIIERHGGTVEKFIGDAVMAVFGIPTVHEDDALRAVRAAWEIRAALARMNTRLDAERGLSIRFRTGVNTGEVVAGDPETGTTLVTGDPVNTAARLEQAAPPGEILLGRLTYSLVRDAVDAEPVEPIAAKGKAEPLVAWRLAAVHAGAAGRARHLDAPLVGRDVELAGLDDAWRRAVDERTPHLVTLVAPAGVGKSRLVREFIANVREDGGRALVGRCLSYGQGITYWPVRELVHQAAGISEADTLSSARGRLDAVAPDPQTGARVASAIGLSQESSPQEELFLAIRRLLEHLAADQPTLVVLEDLHWAEDTFLDLVDQLVDLAEVVPLLLLATTRPELSERRPEAMTEREVRSVIRLESLGTEATASLLAALPGGSAVPPILRDRILDAAEGNPLYVEELLGLLREEGTLRDAGDGTWSVAEGSATVAMPATIAALLTARLEALPADERGVAQRASVIGRSFEVAALAELDPAAPEVSRQLLALVRKELLKPDRAELTAGDAFRFRHVLIRDAAYEALPKAGRAALHERFADWLVRAAGDRLIELEEILAFHLEQAWRYRVQLGEAGPNVKALAARASASYRAAGMRADLRGDAASTITLLGRALDIQPDAGNDNEGARLALAEALIGVAREPEAKTLLDGLQERARLRGDVVIEARAAMLGTLARAGMGDPPLRTPEYEQLVDSIWPIVERSADDLALARYWNNRASMEWDKGHWGPASDASRHALHHAERSGSRRLIQYEWIALSVALLSGDHPLDGALARIEEMLRHEAIDLEVKANLRSGRGLALAMLDRAVEGRAEIAAARHLNLDIGRREAAALCYWDLAWLERLEGNHQLELDALEAAEPDLPGITRLLASARGLCLVKLNRLDEAEAALDSSAGDTWQITVRRAAVGRARLSVARGRPEDALREADAAEENTRADGIQWVNALADALIETGVVAALAGDPTTARRRGADALEVAERKRNLALARKARALLEGDLKLL